MAHLILSKLKEVNQVRTLAVAGEWELQNSGVLENIASSLDYSAPGKRKNVSSVPTMWARPLSMEISVHNPYYPIRQEMIEQWQGMLAAIALAETRKFPIKAQYLDIAAVKGQNNFARGLYELLPAPVNALYTLPGGNPWQELYIFKWNEQAVGMTSPSTLVVPGEEGNWGELPWYDPLTRRLQSPHSFLNEPEKIALRGWLKNLIDELNNHPANNATNTIRQLLNKFRDSLSNVDKTVSLSDNNSFFDAQIDKGVLIALNRPLKLAEQKSMVQLIRSEAKKGIKVKPLIIIDREIVTKWGKDPHNVWVYKDRTFASITTKEELQRTYNDVIFIESKDFFLPKLTFIDAADALPGAFLPPITPPLIFNGQEITPLIPIQPTILAHLTAEDLINILQLSNVQTNEGSVLRVTINLPLSGMDNDESEPKIYSVSRDYPITKQNLIAETPVLEIWPYFQVDKWQEYYAFYYDIEAKEQTFQASIPRPDPDSRNTYSFQEGDGSYKITKLTEFPSYIVAQQTQQNRNTIIGLILLKKPPKIDLTETWKVGVDFGTSFTNIYTNKKGVVKPLELENLLLKITNAPRTVRLGALFAYFIPENFIPEKKPLPLASVLTTRGAPTKTADNTANIRPFFDGRIYIQKDPTTEDQKSEDKELKPDYIKTNLKWNNLENEDLLYNGLFIKHLILHITALAAKNAIKEIKWYLSYPSAFSIEDRDKYIQSWLRATEHLEEKTGIKQICPQDIDDTKLFRTESLAVAQYFGDEEGHNLINSTCIDLGGGTTDISIWQKRNLIHQCSLQLAGKHLFSNILQLNPAFVKDTLKYNFDTELPSDKFQAQVDHYLRLYSEDWLKNQKNHAELEKDFQGFVRLTALGISGIYYYIGIILKVLYEEGKLESPELTYIYMGGNGSRFLNWLSRGGKFEEGSAVSLLLSRMLSKGSGFNDLQRPTKLSRRPKDEVACGLVREETQLKELQKDTPDLLIAGENCAINDHAIKSNNRLNLNKDKKISHFPLFQPEQLEIFLNEFNLAVIELKKTKPLYITPFPNFNEDTEELEDFYSTKLWRLVQDKLNDNLCNFVDKNLNNIRLEPPFILGLKALLTVLSEEWARR